MTYSKKVDKDIEIDASDIQKLSLNKCHLNTEPNDDILYKAVEFMYHDYHNNLPVCKISNTFRGACCGIIESYDGLNCYFGSLFAWIIVPDNSQILVNSLLHLSVVDGCFQLQEDQENMKSYTCARTISNYYGEMPKKIKCEEIKGYDHDNIPIKVQSVDDNTKEYKYISYPQIRYINTEQGCEASLLDYGKQSLPKLNMEPVTSSRLTKPTLGALKRTNSKSNMTLKPTKPLTPSVRRVSSNSSLFGKTEKKPLVKETPSQKIVKIVCLPIRMC
jgi:hypothetical protein